MKLSARNQLSGTVKSINEGAAIANVELDVNGQRLVASITVEAAASSASRRARRSRRSSRRPTSSSPPPTERDQDLHATATGCSQAAARRRRSSRWMVEIHAHRAGPLIDGIPVDAEQTLPAFARTWSEQRVVCELDVRFTADGAAVVFHDPDLRRMSGARGRVHELDLAAFCALQTDILGAGRRLALAPAPVPLATLDEVLRLARRSRAGLNVELKNLPWQSGFDPTRRRPNGWPPSCAAPGSPPTA